MSTEQEVIDIVVEQLGVDKADVTSAKSFIEDLMPEHPIYIPLLPKEAQEVMAKSIRTLNPPCIFWKTKGLFLIMKSIFSKLVRL